MIRNNLDLPDTLHEIEKEGRGLRLLPKVEGAGVGVGRVGGGRAVSHQTDRQTPCWLAGSHH